MLVLKREQSLDESKGWQAMHVRHFLHRLLQQCLAPCIDTSLQLVAGSMSAYLSFTLKMDPPPSASSGQ
jgi:hypothetical protein